MLIPLSACALNSYKSFSLETHVNSGISGISDGTRSHVGRVSNEIWEARGGSCLFRLPDGYL